MRNWYILFTNYENTLAVMERLIKANLPKGCGAYIPTVVRGTEYFKTRLYTKSLYPFYLFICCNDEKNLSKLITKMAASGVDGYFLRTTSGELATLTADEIRSLETDGEIPEFVESINKNTVYETGDNISVVSGPMRGVTGTVTAITKKYVYINYLTHKGKQIELPLLYSDIQKKEI